MGPSTAQQMANLPVELLYAITQDVCEDPCIFNLRLVSKTLNSVVTPLAFRVVVICDSVKSVLQGCNEYITSLVQKVICRGDLEPTRDAGIEALQTVFAELRKFLKIIHLDFVFDSCFREDVIDTVPTHPSHYLRLQRRLLSTVVAHSPPLLVSLTLNNMIAVPDEIYAQEEFHRLFRPLQKLDIAVQYNWLITYMKARRNSGEDFFMMPKALKWFNTLRNNSSMFPEASVRV
ncbi:hypothetical protein C8F04DRAFT_1201255 [Mycena alexandri]|uniref:F-box domain-containing protein n=1 Tax=Mycena alexandri TaxID=1745969 RepID=A0AAD6RXB3_9AGAR|nr:hypothetical protein C8F04DRAFT_1201255 [Mycena alexandri]